MQKYKFLIFDLDDTILDFKHIEKLSIEKIFNNNNVPFTETTLKRYRTINTAMWQMLEKGLISKNEVLVGRFEKFFTEYGISIDGNSVEDQYRSYLNEGYTILPYARELLQNLIKEGYTIIAGTNGLSVTQMLRLKGSNMLHLFHDIFISEDLGFEKPHVNFYKPIFEKYPEMTIENTLMIGDSLSSDIQGAKNMGLDSMWIRHSRPLPEKIEPTFIIEELSQIEEILIPSVQEDISLA